MAEKTQKRLTLACVVSVLLSVACMFFCLDVESVRADEPADLPTVYAANVTVTQGNGTYIYVYAKNFVNLAGLDVVVRYDDSAFTLGSVSKGSFVSGALADVNAQSSGEVKLSLVSVDGLNGGGLLLSVCLYAKSNAEVKDYATDIIVGDCYDSALNPVAVVANGCVITVKQKQQASKTVYFSAGYSSAVRRKGDEFTVRFYTNNSYGFASADFEINFDDQMLQCKSVGLGESLKNAESATFSINDKTGGYVKISYAALSAASTYVTAVETTFVVVGDNDGQSSIEFIASALYNSDLEAYNGNTVTVNVKTEKIPEVVAYPKISLVANGEPSATAELDIVAEKDALLAAGDFFVYFDPELFECTEIVKTLDNSMVVGNTAFKSGVARFSFIYEDGITEDTVIARLRFNVLAPCGTTAAFRLEGSKITDKNYIEQTVEYEGTSLTVSHVLINHEAKSATCTEPGWAAYDTCSRCDYTTYKEIPALGHKGSAAVEENRTEPACVQDGYYDSVIYCSVCRAELSREAKSIPALGHKLTHHEAKEPTYTEAGWEAYDTCSRCDYTTYKEIPALRHDLVYHEAKAPTCTEIGWAEYYTCLTCDYTTYKEIPALGHKESASVEENRTEPDCVQDGCYDSVIYCSVCRAELSREVKSIPALGHKESASVEENRTEPTCVQDGYYDSVIYCSVCRAELSREVKSLPALGHKESAAVEENRAEPDCVQDGCYDSVIYCSVCHAELSREQKTIAALGHDIVHHGGKAATCTENGWEEYDTCSRCDYSTYKEITKLGHKYGGWIVETEATANADGLQYQSCSICGHREERVIPKLAESADGGCFGSVGRSDMVIFLIAMLASAFAVGVKRKK